MRRDHVSQGSSCQACHNILNFNWNKEDKQLLNQFSWLIKHIFSCIPQTHHCCNSVWNELPLELAHLSAWALTQSFLGFLGANPLREMVFSELHSQDREVSSEVEQKCLNSSHQKRSVFHLLWFTFIFNILAHAELEFARGYIPSHNLTYKPFT